MSGAASAFGYDGLSRLSSLGHDLAGSGADQMLGFGYNAASQIARRTASNDGFAWTAAMNVSRAYEVNGLNQYTEAGGARLDYDANGNLSASPDMVGGAAGTTGYTYDAENRLVASSGLRTAGLAYDPLGRLFRTAGGAAGATEVLYDGDELVAEYNGAGALKKRYVHGTGTDDPVLWYEGAGLGDRRSLFADHQGSVIAVADAAGNPLQINSYDPWGVPGPNNAGRFAYTGQIWLPELGMYHYKARIYSPTLGRFLQTDPIGYDDQVNLYAYVGNDPVNGTDPTGTSECSTGSRLEGGGSSAGCRTLDGYQAEEEPKQRTQFAQRPGIGHNRGPAWRARRPPRGAPRIGANGLRSHEGGARNGHVLRVHAAKTDNFLRGRVERGLSAAPTFENEGMANAALTAAVSQNSSHIKAWLTSETPSSKRISFDSPIPVGRVMNDRFETREGYKAVFILSPAPTRDGGDFSLITGWVE